jgi:hypothetical protein
MPKYLPVILIIEIGFEESLPTTGFPQNRVLQRLALKPKPRSFLKALRSNAFKKLLGSFDRELL